MPFLVRKHIKLLLFDTHFGFGIPDAAYGNDVADPENLFDLGGLLSNQK